MSTQPRIYGLEVETVLHPAEGLSLQASYSYLNTKLTQFTPPTVDPTTLTFGGVIGGYDLLAATPLQGKRLANTPDHKLTVGMNYVLPLPEDIGKVTFGATYIYTGKIYYGEDTSIASRYASIFAPTDGNYNTSYSPGYGLVNFNLGWERVGGSNIDAQLFVTNAFNKRYYDARGLSGSRGYTVRYLGEPRMYGGRLKVRFGK